MREADRIRYYLDHSHGKSVVTMNYADWSDIVRFDGHVTQLEQAPDKLSGVKRDARFVVAVASGISNSSPGIDIVRLDPDDAPYIYNTDHDTVVERLTEHPSFGLYLQKAGVEDSPEIREAVDLWIWIIGPEKDPNHHWAIDIPEHIRNARRAEPGEEGNAC